MPVQTTTSSQGKKAPVSSRSASDTVISDLAAADTQIGKGDKTDPEIKVLTPTQAEDLSQARISRPQRPSIDAAAQRAAAQQRSREADYAKLATVEERQAFREFGQRYRALEKRLVEMESAKQAPASRNWLGNALRGVADWYELRQVKGEIRSIRKEERRLIGLVHERAEVNGTKTLFLRQDTPALLQRASVPENRQGHLPRFNMMAAHIAKEVNDRATVEQPLQYSRREQMLVISRRNAAGETESMMFSYREDGKVSYYRKNGGETEWKREGTIWNDSAVAVATRFAKGKSFPRVIKPPEGSKRALEPVKFDEEWGTAAIR